MRDPIRGRFVIAGVVLLALAMAFAVAWFSFAGMPCVEPEKAASSHSIEKLAAAPEPIAERKSAPLPPSNESSKPTALPPAVEKQAAVFDIHPYPELPPVPFYFQPQKKPIVPEALAEDNPDDNNAQLAEFENKTVKDIDVRGLMSMSESALLRLIRTRKGNKFKQKIWEEDWHRLDDTNRFLNIRITEPISLPGGIRLTIDLVEKPTIVSVKVQGLGDSDAAKWKKDLAALEGDVFDKGRFHVYCADLEQYARDCGYTKASIGYTVQSVATHRGSHFGKENEIDDAVTIAFDVNLGPATFVRRLELKGLQAFSKKEIESEIKTKRGEGFCVQHNESDRANIATFYRKAGYADVTVQERVADAGEITPAKDSEKAFQVDLVFDIDEGPQHVVGEVAFEGNAAIASRELQRVLQTQTGALLTDEAVKRDQKAVQIYYVERGWTQAVVSAVRVRVTDPERLKFTSNLWDVTFRVTENRKTVALEFVTGNGARDAGVVLGGNTQKEAEPKRDVAPKPMPDPKTMIQRKLGPKTDDPF